MRYRGRDFAGFLLSGDGHSKFSLRAKDPFGKELLSVQFSLRDGVRNGPRGVLITFFAPDSMVPHEIVNKRPQLNGDGGWELDFRDRTVTTSIRNFIFTPAGSHVEFVVVRKDAIEVDAVEVLSPMSVFATVLALFETSV